MKDPSNSFTQKLDVWILFCISPEIVFAGYECCHFDSKQLLEAGTISAFFMYFFVSSVYGDPIVVHVLLHQFLPSALFMKVSYGSLTNIISVSLGDQGKNHLCSFRAQSVQVQLVPSIFSPLSADAVANFQVKLLSTKSDAPTGFFNCF